MPAAELASERPAQPALLRWAIAVYLTIRISALGFTLVLPLVGAASVAAGHGDAPVGAGVGAGVDAWWISPSVC